MACICGGVTYTDSLFFFSDFHFLLLGVSVANVDWQRGLVLTEKAKKDVYHLFFMEKNDRQHDERIRIQLSGFKKKLNRLLKVVVPPFWLSSWASCEQCFKRGSPLYSLGFHG